MTRKNRNGKKPVDMDQRVQEFFTQTKDYFLEADFDVIEEGYECLRQVVAPDMYSEVAMELETSVLVRRKEEELITLNTVLNDAVKNLGLDKESSEHLVINLKDLSSLDASYNDDKLIEDVEARGPIKHKTKKINK